MTLKDYVDAAVRDRGVTATDVLREVAKDSGVSFQTCSTTYRGAVLQRYDKAKAISDATDGLVTIQALCEGTDDES